MAFKIKTLQIQNEIHKLLNVKCAIERRGVRTVGQLQRIEVAT